MVMYTVLLSVLEADVERSQVWGRGREVGRGRKEGENKPQ